MRDITREMIKMYQINKIGFDFMGYTFNNVKNLSYHHLIIPRRLEGEESKENGAILVQKTSHEYLHKIELIDHDMFLKITSEMIDENIKGYLSIDNLRAIRDVLETFEREYSHLRTKNGKQLIKYEYLNRRVYL